MKLSEFVQTSHFSDNMSNSYVSSWDWAGIYSASRRLFNEITKALELKHSGQNDKSAMTVAQKWQIKCFEG